MRNKLLLSLFLIVIITGVQGKFTTINAQPAVEYTYTGVCVGSPTIFTVNTAITNVNAVQSWNWNFGDGNFSTLQNPTHTFAGVGGYTVTLTITDTNGLVGSVVHVVTIEKLPIANFAYNTPNCSNDSVQFTDLSSTENGFIRYWIWNFGDGTPVDTLYFPFDNPNVKHVFPAPGTFVVTLSIMNSDSCKDLVSLPVTVIPSPIANFFFDGRCEDQVVQFTDASFANGAGNVVAWNWDFGDPVSGINNTSNLIDPIHTFQNPGTYTVLLQVTNFNNCTDTISKLVVINPHPPVDFTHTSTCMNDLTYFDPDTAVMNVGSIATWLWDFGDGQTSNAPNTAHAYIAPGTYTVTLTVTDTLGCMNVITHLVVVNALPFAHFDAGTSNCEGATVLFNDQSSLSAGYIIQWIWNFGDGNIDTVNFPTPQNVQHVYALAGTYSVKLTIKASDSCTNFEIQNITIHPNPVANFDFTTPTCNGTAIDFTDISQLNGAGSIVQWQWDFGDPGSGILNFATIQNPSHVFTASGTFTVKLVVSSGNGCTDTVTRNVIVKPLPPVDFNTTHNCQNNAVNFDPDAVIMNLPIITSFFWEFGDGVTSPLSNPTHIYVTAGTYPVTLTIVDTAGCTNSITKPINIIPEPNANFSSSTPACKESSVEFTNLSSAPQGYIYKSEWNFGDGTPILTVTSLAPVFHTYATANTFNVTLTVTTYDSCKRTISIPFTILQNPLADFSYLTSCVNSPVQFNDLSQQGAGGFAGWSWNFGDPPSGTNNVSTLPDPSHIYTSGGTYVVTLVVTNTGGCSDTIQKNVLVHGLPTVDFTSSPGCVSDSTHFISSTFVNAAATVSRLWDFGDGFTSPDIDPYHIYLASGSFTVTLTITDTAGCVNTKQHTVSIVPPPTSLFQISVQTCANTPVFFTNQSSTPGGTITSFFWEFGDGLDTLINAPASGSISHTYIVGGSYTVKLTVYTSLGCENTSQKPLTISASPLALFNYDNTCAGSAVNFTDMSQVNSGTSIVNWLWDFGDPVSGTNNISNLQNPLHIYNNPGTYTVLLTVENASGCPDTVSKTIIISPKPPVDFGWTSTCLGTPTQFTTNTTVTNIAAVASYDWDFGDGTAHNTSQQDPIHVYTTTGIYTVVLTITDTAGCENAVSHVVSITPQPTALFSFASACLGASTYFTDHSFTSSGEPIINWHWDFGEITATNDTSNLQNPVWIYNTIGVYNVSLIVTSQSGCQDTAIMSLQVFGNPTAAFTYTAAPCDNGAVYFQDSSYSQQSTIVGWNWEFEPNSFSTLQNPVYVFYNLDSCYNVRLIATDVRGCVDTAFKTVCVPAEFNFTFAFSTTCLRDTTYFTPQLLSPSTDSLVFFNWNFGDPTSGIQNTSTLKLPHHYYSVPGTYTVSLQAIDVNNCPLIKYRDIVVLPLPVPSFTFTSGICDSTIYFNESSSGNGSNISQWIWSYGDGVTDTVFAPATADLQHKYINAGIYIVSLSVTNANGCTEVITDSSVLVKPCIDAAFSLIDTLICQNNMLAFADSSSSGLPTTEWYWNFGDGTDTTYYVRGNPINHVFTSAGTFNVTMRISTEVDGQTVSDSTQIAVFVNPTPLPDFTFDLVCYLQDAKFTNMTSGNGTQIKDYSWNFGEPTSNPNDTSSQRNPVHLYNAPGTYTVKLVTQNTIGCSDSIQKSLIVYGLPDANYSYDLSCAGDKTTFTDLSVLAVAPIVDWQWTYNDSEGVIGRRAVQNPEYIFNTPGDYLVNLMVTDTNGCYDTINQKITTWSIPTSIFTYADNFNDVQGQLQFTNTSFDATKYYWTFGNGDDSYGENPVAFYQNDGTYNITLVTWNDKNCTDTLTMAVSYTHLTLPTN
jgi:PKD repeat protein